MATTFDVLDSLAYKLRSEYELRSDDAQYFERALAELKASISALPHALDLPQRVASSSAGESEIARLREEALRTRATQDRRLAAHLSQRCDELMERNQELTRVIERYRDENATLLRKIVGMLEPRESGHGHISSKVIREFHRLAAIWRMNTIHMSDVREKCSHPAYQQIIALGESALPLIFEELEIEPDDWFVALRAITGVDPVAFVSRSNFEEITHAWLSWAKSHGYYRRDSDEEGLSEPQLANVCR